MRAPGKFLDGAGLLLADLGRTNVLRSAACGRVEEGVFVCEIVEAAFRDDLEHGESLVTKDSDRELTARNEFLDQQLAVVFQALGHRGVDLALVLHDRDAYGRSLTRRLNDIGNRHRRPLALTDNLP